MGKLIYGGYVRLAAIVQSIKSLIAKIIAYQSLLKQEVNVEKNIVFRFTAGAYSDYSVLEWMIALKDFKPKEVLSEFLSLNPKEKEHYGANYDAFIAWVIDKEYAKMIEDPGIEWYVGDYGNYGTKNLPD